MAPIPKRLPHTLFLLAGLAGGLWLALPLDLSGAGCPPAGEGRNMCLVQDQWAPLLTTVGLSMLLAWLLADLLFCRLPEWRAGSRTPRPRRDHGRDALEADDALRAASWNVLPPPRRREPTPAITVAAIVGGPPELRAVRPLDRPAPPPGRGVRFVRDRNRAIEPDRVVLAACWDAATRRSAQLIDAVAVDLGLARDELRPAPSSDPDPLLTSATWSKPKLEAVPSPPPHPRRRASDRREDDAAALLRAASWGSHPHDRRAA